MEDRPEDRWQEAGPASSGSRWPFRRWWERIKEFWQELLARRQKVAPAGEGALQRGLAAPSPDEIARWTALLGQAEDPTHPRALDELVVIGQPAVPALIEALQSETWIQAFRAAEALGLIGDRRAVRPLLRLLDHANSNVRWGAAEALGRIQSRWARGRLRHVSQEDESRTSWGETVAESAERAVANIDRTWISWLINVVQILFYLALCAAVVYAAYRIVRQGLEQRALQPTATPTVIEATVTPSVTPTATPLPTFQPITATVKDTANVRDRPDSATGTRIGVLHLGDEILVYGGYMDTQGDWWFLMRLTKINNPATVSDVLQEGRYGWIHSSLVSGVAASNIGPTVAAVETMRAGVATPTPIGSSLDLATPTLAITATITATVSP